METQGEEHEPSHGTGNFEKRRHPRFSVDLTVEYYKFGSLVKHDGKAMNASQGGLLLYSSEPLPIGLYLRLKLSLTPVSKLSAIEAIAEVVWTDIEGYEGGGDCRTGVKFSDASSKDMSQLKEFLLGLSQ